jgi:hypothetical protein
VLSVLSKPRIEKFKRLYTPEKSISAKIARRSGSTSDEHVGSATNRDTVGAIVRSVSYIHWKLKERTLLHFVLENHPLGIFEQLFHDRTSLVTSHRASGCLPHDLFPSPFERRKKYLVPFFKKK